MMLPNTGTIALSIVIPTKNIIPNKCSKVFKYFETKNKRNAVNSAFLLLLINAADRNRTGTGITTHGILSPGRLPVPPLRQLSNCFLLFVINKRNDPEETRTLDLRRDRAAL